MRARASEISRRFGRGALLPFQIGDDKLVFAPDGVDGVVVYGLAGRVAVVVGDPIGQTGDVWTAFDAFLEMCRRRRHAPTVYQASDEACDQLARRGFRTIKVGREARVDLAAFDLAGPRRANLRHTVSRARRGGVSVSVHLAGLPKAEHERLKHGLKAIDDAWRAHAGPELGFTVGRFDPSELGAVCIAIAQQEDGTPVAFATFRPTGTDGGWVLDLMRRLPGGTPGAFELCLAEAASAMRAAGASGLSLGLVPLSGLSSSSSILEERLLARGSQAVRPWYDTVGLEFFKQKFDPTWEARYIAVRGRDDLLRLAIALLRLHLGGFRRAARTALTGTVGRRVVRPDSHPRRVTVRSVSPGHEPDQSMSEVP